MNDFLKAYQDDAAEFERVFGGTIKEVEASLAVQFKNASGELGFQLMMAERVRAGTQSTVRGHFSVDFLEGLKEAKIVSPQPTPN